MVTGAMLGSRLLCALPFGGAILLGPYVSVAASQVIAGTLLWPSGVLAALSFFLFGAGPIIWTIASTTLRQTITPQAVLGQVSAIFLTVNTGARPIGAAIGGLVGAHYGETACLLLSTAGFFVQAIIIVLSPMRSLRSLPAPA